MPAVRTWVCVCVRVCTTGRMCTVKFQLIDFLRNAGSGFFWGVAYFEGAGLKFMAKILYNLTKTFSIDLYNFCKFNEASCTFGFNV